VGTGTKAPETPLHALNTKGTALKGESTSLAGAVAGVYGVSSSIAGSGVEGLANAKGGTAAGVRGEVFSPTGFGVLGVGTATTGVNYGVRGETGSATGYGVAGVNQNTSGDAVGVYGTTASTAGRGVLGVATSLSGQNRGVHGESPSTQGIGVYGAITATTGGFSSQPGAGVWGQSSHLHSAGVYGENTALGGRAGGWGVSTASGGTGIRADALGTNGRYGLRAEAEGETTTTYGILTVAQSGGYLSTNRTRGIYAIATSEHARAVYGAAAGTRQDVSTQLCGVYGFVNSTMGYGVYSEGNMGTSGTKAFVQPHPEDASRAIRFICLEGNESGTYFRGTARLKNGVAEIDIPEEWKQVTAAEGITVQVTPRALAVLFVETKRRDRIVVRGRPDCEFDYFVNGVRRGFAEYEPYVPNSSFRPEVRGVPFGGQWPQALRDILVKNGILNPDYTPNEATAARLGWELKDPDDESLDLHQRSVPGERRRTRTTSTQSTQARTINASHR